MTVTREWIEWRLQIATVQMAYDQERGAFNEWADREFQHWDHHGSPDEPWPPPRILETRDRKMEAVQALLEELRRVRQEEPPMMAPAPPDTTTTTTTTP